MPTDSGACRAALVEPRKLCFTRSALVVRSALLWSLLCSPARAPCARATLVIFCFAVHGSISPSVVTCVMGSRRGEHARVMAVLESLCNEHYNSDAQTRCQTREFAQAFLL